MSFAGLTAVRKAASTEFSRKIWTTPWHRPWMALTAFSGTGRAWKIPINYRAGCARTIDMKTRLAGLLCVAAASSLMGCAAPGGPPNYQAQQNFMNALGVGAQIEQNRNYQRQYAPPPPQSVNTICRRNPSDGSVFCTSN